ncbi:MAG: NADH:ubiquinone oxidoreductase subunit NDUFA12 [Magnetospiraceae bacterium]
MAYSAITHLGTFLMTKFYGEPVGEDEFGNKYYRNAKQKRHGKELRWVVYNGEVEGSKVPAEWHAWLHHTTVDPLVDRQRFDWQQTHQPNLTGTLGAYRPDGHDLKGGKRAPATGDYEAWTPN